MVPLERVRSAVLSRSRVTLCSASAFVRVRRPRRQKSARETSFYRARVRWRARRSFPRWVLRPFLEIRRVAQFDYCIGASLTMAANDAIIPNRSGVRPQRMTLWSQETRDPLFHSGY